MLKFYKPVAQEVQWLESGSSVKDSLVSITPLLQFTNMFSQCGLTFNDVVLKFTLLFYLSGDCCMTKE
jgi:hypothetical protein